MVSACFNFGPGFLQKNICKVIAANQNDPRIVNMWEHLSDKQAAKYPGLKKRRQKEAALYKTDMV
jgi:GH24 family phage-related lysozyme (muramidase)